MNANDYERFIQRVREKLAIDLSLYKETQMKRRLKSLYEKRGFANFVDFFDNGMMKDEVILQEFLERMTINVSEFFRNAKRWHVLENKILPPLLEQNRRPNIWSAACSTGEEPYSLVMLLARHLPLGNIHILATDIDEAILKRAKLGIYTERSLKEVSKEDKERYFIKEPMGYRIKEEIKARVTFRRHDLLVDPFDTNMDLIVCRNVLIYFTEEAKEKLYHKFSQALKKGGILFVGSTEQIFHPEKYGFETADTFFYRKI